MNFQKDAHINIYTSRKLSAKWAMSTKKQLEWTFLLVFFQESKFFLVSFLKMHVVEEKGGLNRVVDLKLKWIKNNPNIVKCSNIRKYNCSKIITFCCNTRQDINKEMKKKWPQNTDICNYQYTFTSECSFGQCLTRLYNDCSREVWCTSSATVIYDLLLYKAIGRCNKYKRNFTLLYSLAKLGGLIG